MKKKLLYIVILLAMVFPATVTEARLCDIGAENFYENFQKYVPMEYRSTDLYNFLSKSNKDMYEFTVINSKTNKSKTKILINADEEGYINEIRLIVCLSDSDVVDIKIIEATCFQSIGLSNDEIKWLAQHEKIIPVAINENIMHSEVYSRRNDLVIYTHKLPFDGGLVLVFIDNLSLDEFYNKWIKPYKSYN